MSLQSVVIEEGGGNIPGVAVSKLAAFLHNIMNVASDHEGS